MFAIKLNNRHTLHPIDLADATELFALTAANREHLRQWLPWLDRNQAVGDTEKFIAALLVQQANQQGLVAVIRYDGVIAGVVGYNKIDYLQRVGYIGYWLGASYQGQGIMTASCWAMIEYGCTVLNLDRIVIACATQNQRSQAIPKRLGFIHENTIPRAEWLYDHFVDHEIYVRQCSLKQS